MLLSAAQSHLTLCSKINNKLINKDIDVKKFVITSTILFSLIFNTVNAEDAEKAVTANTTSYSARYINGDVKFFYLQADGTFALGKNFGASLGANNLYINDDYDSDNVQNIRAAAFYRSPDFGRIELAYQNLFFDGESDSAYSITGEYYFENWTLGAYVLSDDLSELNDLNIYSNIYFTDNVRLELDLLDSSDSALLSAKVNFQAPEYIGNEWQFFLSYGETFRESEYRWGIGVKYTPDFNDTLKRFYRNYSTNVKSVFFL